MYGTAGIEIDGLVVVDGEWQPGNSFTKTKISVNSLNYVLHMYTIYKYKRQYQPSIPR